MSNFAIEAAAFEWLHQAARGRAGEGEIGSVKEPEPITLVEGLELLKSHLPAEEAKTRLRQAFIRKAFPQAPLFAFPYDEADIDWTTGAVKIPRKRDRFCPTFSRAEFNTYFFKEEPAMLDRVPRTDARREVEMANDEISEEGRKARFEQWEKLGVDAIKQDLTSGGYRLIGGPPQVRALPREWLLMKEKEEQAEGKNIEVHAFELLKAIERATQGSAAPVVLEELRDLPMSAGQAQAAFVYLKGKGLIEANFRIFYAARMSVAGHDALRQRQRARRVSPDEALSDAALAEIRGALAEIKAQLPAIVTSNALKAEIDTDIKQIEVETERPAPRRQIVKIFLESLRDNLAKAAGAGAAAAAVATVGGILAKYFGLF